MPYDYKKAPLDMFFVLNYSNIIADAVPHGKSNSYNVNKY